MTGKQAIRSYERLKKALYRVIDVIEQEEWKSSDSDSGLYYFDPSEIETDVRGWIDEIQAKIDEIQAKIDEIEGVLDAKK